MQNEDIGKARQLMKLLRHTEHLANNRLSQRLLNYRPLGRTDFEYQRSYSRTNFCSEEEKPTG